MAGVIFTLRSETSVCGNPHAAGAVCSSATTELAAPLAAVTAECGEQGLLKVTEVCFNPNYTNPVVPITGKQMDSGATKHACCAIRVKPVCSCAQQWLVISSAARVFTGSSSIATMSCHSARQPAWLGAVLA